MAEPPVRELVRDLAEETSGWLHAEVVHLRREVDHRVTEARIASVRLAVGLVFGALGLQLLLVALVVWLARDVGLGWSPSLGLVGGVMALFGLWALVAARATGRRA